MHPGNEDEHRKSNEKISGDKIPGSGEDIRHLQQEQKNLEKINHQLGERIKELNCLYRLSEISSKPRNSMEDIIEQFIEIIPSSYQYPDITCVRIILYDKVFTTKTFRESIWKQEAGILVNNFKVGKVEVFYTETRRLEAEGPFLKEERFLINTIVDILGNSAEQKKGEQEIRNLNRLYQFISQVNETILKLEDQEEIFREACRIAIEFGKFRMAWIGFYDEKEERLFPFTWAGHEEGYLESIKADTDNLKVTGKGPTGKAVQSRTYQYCNDIANDPNMFPWRDEAIKRNYRSSIALPVIVNSKLAALYVLYMSEINFFNEIEIRLLLKVTDNIAYALDKIRIRELQQKAALELQESEEKFRSLVEQSLVGVYILQEGKFKYVNPGFEKAISYSKEELLNKMSIEDLIHPDDLDKVRRNYFLRMGGKNIPNQYTFRAITKNRDILHLEIIATIIVYEGKPAIIGTIIDISDRVEEEIRINRAVMQAQENERLQIGMELHDNVKQILAASGIFLDVAKKNLLDNTLNTELLDNLKSYNVEAIVELRRLSHQLAPSIDSSTSLVDKINWIVKSLKMEEKLEVSINMGEFEKPIDNNTQLAFYRILQEQLSNILKYANASKTEINIQSENHHVLLEILDDGIGFDMNVKKSGIGLENIMRRSQLLNGKAEIVSSPGQGCRVTVQVPLP